MKLLLSLILPIHNEADNIAELYERSKKVLNELGPHEIIFVNDGSTDDSLKKLLALATNDLSVKIIDLSKNFGHQVAITAGLDYASGEATVIMDSDLQDTPETIREMVAKWREGYQVVFGKRRSRKDGVLKKATAFLFYRLLKQFANIEIPEDTGDFRLMDAVVVAEMRKLRENARFMRGLTSWVGFKQTAVLFDRDERKRGTTNYPFKKMLHLAMDALTSFSYIPLKIATFLGLATALVSFIGIIYALIRKIAFPEQVISGWTFSIIAIFFIGGVQLIVLGVIGEYIGRIYTESQRRPLYIVREKINFV